MSLVTIKTELQFSKRIGLKQVSDVNTATYEISSEEIEGVDEVVDLDLARDNDYSLSRR